MTEVMLTLSRGGNVVTLDLFTNDIPALNKSFDDIETLKTRGEFSQTFRVPLNDTNAGFFGNIADPNYLGFDFKTKIDASISVATIPIATGYCQVKNIIKKSDANTEIELVFFADVRNLATAIGDKKLADIEALPDLNHAMTRANVENPPANTLWTLIDRGAKFSEGGETGTRKIFDTNNPLYVGELTPAVNWKWLFDNILKDAGFVYESNALGDILERYWMPFINKQVVSTTDNVDNTLFAIDTPSNYSFNAPANTQVNITADASMAEVFDNGGNVSAGIFTAPYTAIFTFRFTLQIKKVVIPAGQNATWNFYLAEVGGGILPTTDGAQFMFVSAPESDEFVEFTYERSYFVTEGTQMRLQVLTGLSNAGGQAYVLGSNTGWQLVTTTTPLQGTDVNLPLNAPDMKQVDFVRDVIRMHCLNVSQNNNVPNLLRIEPFSDYIGSGNTLDYTDKLDVGGNRDVTIKPTADIQNKNLIFTYKAGGEYLSDLFVKQGGRVYGERRIDNTENDFATGDLKIELETRSTPSNEVNGTNIPIPKFINESGAFVNPFARVLFNAGTASVAIFDDITEEGVMTEIPILNNFSALVPDVTDRDLNWAPETPLQFINSIPFNNLFNEYWAAYYNELYSDESRIMEAYFNLNTTDYFSLKGSDKLFIKDGYWRLLEITGFEIGSGEPTKMKLAKIVNVVPDCLYTPVAITTDRQVLFNGNGETMVAGTEACCVKYGYEWNGGKTGCYALPTGRNTFLSVPSAIIQTTPSATRGINNSVDASEYVTVNGDNNTVRSGNHSSAVFGYLNEIEADAGTSIVVGRNVKVKYKGIHYGASDTLGLSQGGIIHLEGKGEFNATGDEIEMFVDGRRLELENGAVWSCELNISLHDSGARPHSVIFGFMINKTGAGVAEVSAITTIAEHGSVHSIDLEVDVTTNTAQHRISVKAQGGSGYPFTSVIVSGVLRYSQAK